MKFKYNGKIYNVDITKYTRARSNTSNLHERVRDILKELYPLDQILEEFTLPGLKPALYADFFIPSQKLAVEAHGKQHVSYSKFFFKTKQKFYKAQRNDAQKIEWFHENNITLIGLYYDESPELWKHKILHRVTKRL